MFLGIRFRHDTGCVCLSEKCVEKLTLVQACFQAGFRSLEDILWTFGVCVWASAVLGLERSSLYYIYKFVRRRQRQKTPGSLAVWPCIVDRWESWIRLLLSNQPCQVLRPRQPQYVIFTDASDDGWGAVIFDKNGNGDTIMGDHWSPIDASRHISLRELMVVRLAFSRWIQRGVSVVVFMDNTTAIGQLRRGRSNAFLANSELRRLKMVIESKHLTITGFQYVRSAENHADYWSREGLRILQLASTEGHGLLEGHRSVPFEDPFASNLTFEAGRK